MVSFPQNSYKTSYDLWEATLKKRTMSVQQLARSFGKSNKQTDRYPVTLLYGLLHYFQWNQLCLFRLIIPRWLVNLSRSPADQNTHMKTHWKLKIWPFSLPMLSRVLVKVLNNFKNNECFYLWLTVLIRKVPVEHWTPKSL